MTELLKRGDSLTELVVRELERMIFTRELGPGDRINEQLLSVKLGVSRGPVREARRALERAGLVVGIANRGLFVRELDKKEIAEMYDMRALVTGFICERLAQIATPEQIKALRASIAEMERAVQRDDSVHYYEANLKFHDLLFVYADHVQAKQLNDSLVHKMHLVRQLVHVPKLANAEHTAIVSAIVERKSSEARKLGIKHVLGGKSRWLAQA